MTRHEAYIDPQWREHGLAQVVVSRIRDGGADCATFLVDLWCLGVKDALFVEDLSLGEAAEFVAANLAPDRRESLQPACAKKLIDGAIAYAERLGFSPHRDYRKARRVLSGLDSAQCPTEFVYGRAGRPFYAAGADDLERQEKVLAILEARLGPDGFGYEGSADDDDFADDDELDDEEVRLELMDRLADEPEGTPGFFGLSGLVTALQVCPIPAPPTKVFAALWGPDGKVWDHDDDLQHFTRLLTLYWNRISELILDRLLDDPSASPSPVDIYTDDFPEDKEGHLFFAAMIEWARGFLRATELWPELWSGAVSRPDLAGHWEIVRWWADFTAPGNADSLGAAAEATPPRTLGSSVLALARALRVPPPRP